MIHESTTESVFFYGLFMDENLLMQKGLSPVGYRLAYVPGHGLRIGERATLEISKREEVYGSVMKLRLEELQKLYGEESVADYVPTRLAVIDMDGNDIEATSYILPMKRLSGRNPEYARALSLVASKVGLPNTYLKTIEAWT